MLKSSMIIVRIEPTLKNRVEKILQKIRLNTTQAKKATCWTSH